MSKELTGYPSVDKPWLKYYKKGAEKTIVPPMSIYQLLINNMEKIDYTAICYYGFKITYREFIARIDLVAEAAIGLGIKQGEMVPLILPNIPEARILLYALNKIGAIAYPINPLMLPKNLEMILAVNHVKWVFLFEGFRGKYETSIIGVQDVCNIILLSGDEFIPFPIRTVMRLNKKAPHLPKAHNEMSWRNFLKKKALCKKSVIPYFKPNCTAVIIATSGTTGTPKDVCLSNENLNAMAIQHEIGGMDNQLGDKLLDVLNLSIGYGIATAHYCSVLGLEAIIVPDFPQDVYDYIVKYKPEHFTGGPIHYINLTARFSKAGCISLPPAKNMVSGGAALPKDAEMFLNHTKEGYVENTNDNSNIYVRQGLGCTENGGAATYCKRGTYKFGCVGIPLVLEDMSIFEPDTDHELSYNETGEICISGPTVMQGYLNNAKETEKVLKRHRDGKLWLHTGDLGYVDCDGCFFIIDRIKNIFARKGFNVHPSYITGFIRSLETVEDCAVIGVPHPNEQMVPVAFIKLYEGSTYKQAYSAIVNSCEQNLEETSIPYEFIFVDKLPLNLGGKVDVNTLLTSAGIDYSGDMKKKEPRFIKV